MLRHQLNASLGEEFVSAVSATYAGIYQWTVNVDIAGEGGGVGETAVQLKFGPSAWYANEEDRFWVRTVDRAGADYSRIFLTAARSRQVRQSVVTLHEVLGGLGPDDRRLHDEILDMLKPT